MYSPPASPITVAQAQLDQSAKITLAAAAAIVGGFSSATLGVLNIYPSAVVDQQNTIIVALAGGSLWCKNSVGVWSLTPHTKAQGTAVQADMAAHIQTQQTKNATLQKAIAAAKTVADVNLIVW